MHRVHVGEFFIGRFPVTDDEYARFVRTTGYPAPSIRGLLLITASGQDAVFKELAIPYVWGENRKSPPGHGSHPVVLIRYDDAVAYCQLFLDTLGRPGRAPSNRGGIGESRARRRRRLSVSVG